MSSSYEPVPTSESASSQPPASYKRPHRTRILVALFCAVAFVFYWVGSSWPHPSPTMSYDEKYSIG